MRVADGVLDRDGYLAGPAERRAAGVLAMFADPGVSLVMPDGCHARPGRYALVLRCVQGRFPVITGVEFGHQTSSRPSSEGVPPWRA